MRNVCSSNFRQCIFPRYLIHFKQEILSGLSEYYLFILNKTGMTKLLYIVMSCKEAEQKFDMVITSVGRIAEKKLAEKVKIIFFGPSELLSCSSDW